MSDLPSPADTGAPMTISPEVSLLLSQLQQQNALLQQQAVAMQTLQQRLGLMELQFNNGVRPTEDNRAALRQDCLWARLKPYDKRAGHLRLRTFLEEVGTPMDGGTGAIGSIPVWYAVRPELREILECYRQNDHDPYSPPLLDIATSAEREKIDQAEELWRKTNAGERPKTRNIQQVRARTHDRLAPAAPRSAATPPTVARGAEAFLQQTQAFQAQEVLAPQLQTLPGPLAGRAAALQGLPTAGPTAAAIPAPLPAQAPMATPAVAPVPVQVQMQAPQAPLAPQVPLAPQATLPPPPAPPVTASRHAARAAVARAAQGSGSVIPQVNPNAEILADEAAAADADELSELADRAKQGITRGRVTEDEKPIPGVRRRGRSGVPTGDDDDED